MGLQHGPKFSTARRWRMFTAAAVAATMLLTACASSDGGGPSNSNTVDGAPEFIDPDDPTIERATVLADRLIGVHGDDDTAAAALLASFAAGYSTAQVLRAVELDELLVDGTVSGVEPTGPPLDLDGLEPKGRRRRAGGDTADLPIERLRDAANKIGRANDASVGFLATTVILALAGIGLTPAEIVEVLVLGEVEYVRDGVCYRKVIDNFPERCDAPSDQPTESAAADSAPDAVPRPEEGTSAPTPPPEPATPPSDAIDPTPVDASAFTVVLGDQPRCTPGNANLMVHEPTILTFGADASVGVDGAITCEGETTVHEGTGTWDPSGSTFDISVTETLYVNSAPNPGTIQWSGTIDREGGSITLDGVSYPIS